MTSRWSAVSPDEAAARDYRRRFADLEASGADLHGEARFVDALLEPGSDVLDAGCGFGRVASELARRGHRCVGVDADPHLVALAEAEDAGCRWVVMNLAELDLAEEFDAVVLAGNVVPYLHDEDRPVALARLAEHLRPGGVLVAGFTLAGGELPRGAGEVSLAAYDAWARDAGLELADRFATWDREPYAGGTYAVSVHRR